VTTILTIFYELILKSVLTMAVLGSRVDLSGLLVAVAMNSYSVRQTAPPHASIGIRLNGCVVLFTG